MTPLTGIRPTLIPGLQQISFLPKPEALNGPAATGAASPASCGDMLSQAVRDADTRPIAAPDPPITPPPSFGATTPFGQTVSEMFHDVNARQLAAAASAKRLMAGENVPLHQTMIQIEEARVAFQLMVEVRNKMLESYQELMRMQV
jgi:flagellar hook-basal body complex protein FliE